MSTLAPGGASALVAAEVRAALARARITPTELARRTSRSQTYWWRRITSGETPLDVEDLSTLGAILDLPMTAFIPEASDGPRLRDGDEGRRGKLPRLVSIQLPSDYRPLAFAA